MYLVTDEADRMLDMGSGLSAFNISTFGILEELYLLVWIRNAIDPSEKDPPRVTLYSENTTP